MDRYFICYLRIILLSLSMFTSLSLYAAEVRQPTPERVLHFSEDYSIGRVYIEDETIERQIKYFDYYQRGSEWKHLAEAQGDVTIPAGHRVKLELTWQVWEKPERAKDLMKLPPDAIYRLQMYPNSSFGYIPPEEAIPSDWLTPPIASLTGLKELYFSAVKISGKAMKNLSQCTELKLLRTPCYCTNSGLKAITHIKTLKTLSISAGRLSDKAFVLLKDLPQLEELVVGGAGSADAILPHIAALPKLKFLYLEGDFSNGSMVHLKQSTSLKRLVLYGTHYNNKAVRHVSQIPNLEGFRAHKSRGITDPGVRDLKNIPHLKMLDIGYASLTDRSLTILGQMPSLEYLYLGSCTDDGIVQLSGLKNLKFLWASTHSNSMLGNRSIQAVSQLSQLEELHLSGKNITDEGIRHLAQLKQLRVLHFTWVSIADGSLRTIGGLKTLERLSLEPEQPFTTDGLNHLGQLENLKIFACRGFKKGNQPLDLSGLKSLERLSLRTEYDNKKKACLSWLENEDVLFLQNLDHIDSLNIGSVKLGHSGLQAIADMKKLRRISMGGPLKITDADMTVFDANSQIEAITLGKGNFTGDCLEHLATLKNLKHLRLTSNAAFDQRAVQEFKQKRRLFTLELSP